MPDDRANRAASHAPRSYSAGVAPRRRRRRAPRAPRAHAERRRGPPNAFLSGGEDPYDFRGAARGELYDEFHPQGGTPKTAAALAAAAAVRVAARAAMTSDQRRKAQRLRVASAGFIAALDQSGGSTPRALALYGVSDIRAGDKSEMFDAAHAMRTRIVTSEAFDGDKVFGTILFADTAFNRLVRGKCTATYLWEDKGIVPFLKIDAGLQPEANGVQLMRDIDDLGVTLSRCGRRDPKLDDDDATSVGSSMESQRVLRLGRTDPGLCIFGTKARSVIRSNDPAGIDALVAQQFELAATVMDHGLVPIVEPEVDIDYKDKARSSIRSLGFRLFWFFLVLATNRHAFVASLRSRITRSPTLRSFPTRRLAPRPRSRRRWSAISTFSRPSPKQTETRRR